MLGSMGLTQQVHVSTTAQGLRMQPISATSCTFIFPACLDLAPTHNQPLLAQALGLLDEAESKFMKALKIKIKVCCVFAFHKSYR